MFLMLIQWKMCCFHHWKWSEELADVVVGVKGELLHQLMIQQGGERQERGHWSNAFHWLLTPSSSVEWN